MNNLLLEKCPDMPTYVAKTCKKYTRLDINDNVIECLARNTVDEPFVDITEAERERVKLVNYQKKLEKERRRINELKEQEEYEKETSATGSNH